MEAATRELVRKRARRRCEYCRIHEDDEAYTFHIEHVVPIKHGGHDWASNLAWCCQNCNLAKGSNLSGLVGGEIVPLFNPRKQNWKRHFRWRGPNWSAELSAAGRLSRFSTSMIIIASYCDES